MKKLTIALFLGLIILSCNQSKDQSSKNLDTDANQTDKVAVQSNFSEGIIDVDVSFPGSQLSDLLKKVDPKKGNIKQQLKALAGTLSPEEQKKINTLANSNPYMAMQIIFAPIQSTIYVKENLATAKCNGLTYHLENKVNISSNTGMIHVASITNPAKTVTFNYDKDYFGGSQIQTKIDENTYSKQPTEETQLILGYKCKKTIYTSKINSPLNAEKLEVWSSEQMPKSINFLHPYYVEEEHGIMKIDVFAYGITGPAMVYEFKTVSPKKVSDADLSILQTPPIYNAKTDLLTMGTKLMEILFGAK